MSFSKMMQQLQQGYSEADLKQAIHQQLQPIQFVIIQNIPKKMTLSSRQFAGYTSLVSVVAVQLNGMIALMGHKILEKSSMLQLHLELNKALQDANDAWGSITINGTGDIEDYIMYLSSITAEADKGELRVQFHWSDPIPPVNNKIN